MAEAVDILLSVYDGGKYLRDFVASLGRQTCREFRLLVRDDGSRDDSLQVLKASLAENGLQARFAASSGRHLGVVGSFGALLRESRARGVLFADQDDIWHPEKVDKMRRRMAEEEERRGPDTPILLHSDLRVCGEHGETIADSLIRYQRLSPARTRLADLLVQNHVTGCAMMINGALKDRIRLPFPDHAICHDWYLALLAAAVGEIVFMETPYTDYRKHGSNVFGPREYSFRQGLRIFREGRSQLERRLALTQAQARDFLRQYGDLFSEPDRRTVARWGGIGAGHKPEKIAACLRFGFRKNTVMRTLGMWWAL